jgi:hypothetical protein
MKTLEELSQQVKELFTRQQTQKNELLNLKQLNEQQLIEAKKLLEESKLAQEWALRSFRIDHDGWIWRWDLNRKLYIKTAFRVKTPIIPCKDIEKRHLSDSLIEWLMTTIKDNGTFKLIRQDEYNALNEIDDNVLYVIYEDDDQPPVEPTPVPQNDGWKFGDAMPMVLT